MKANWLLIAFVAVVVPAIAQNESRVSDIADFTKSPTEHVINEIKQPLLARRVKGVVTRKQGDEGPLQNVLFEIQGPSPDRKIRRCQTDKEGRFNIPHLPAGTYRFKATLDGFQSVIGTINVSKKADVTNDIKIQLLVGV